MKRETRRAGFRLLTLSFFYFLSLPLVKELYFAAQGFVPSWNRVTRGGAPADME